MANLNAPYRFTHNLATLAVILAFIVVILGAYTRLSDAGLGCPDWPGCYGHLTVPESTQAIQQADLLYPHQPVEPAKAWAEMIHRYAAGTLGILIVFLAGLAITNRERVGGAIGVPILLVLIVLFQAALGMWTVTLLLLPVVVMGHLLGGMTILALLWWVNLKIRNPWPMPLAENYVVKKYRPWALLGLIIVALQIALGGWVSTNYASLACADFPLCHGQLLPIHELRSAFNLFMPVGNDFQGGYLDSAARVTIQVVHRLGALITAVYLVLLGSWIWASSRENGLRRIVAVIFLFLIVQIGLGILNIVLMLPLSIAVMHNAMAALLLLSVVTLNYALYAKLTS